MAGFEAQRPVARIDGLQFSYPHRRLFTDWSARFPAGLSWVLGDEGSGKSTLLRLLAGDLPAEAGRLQVAGVYLDQDTAHYRAQVFRTDPQSELPQDLTPLQWLAGLQARYPGFDMAAVPALLAQLHLEEHRNKPLFMLSTGSRRKVWLVAAFASGAALTLVDQPFAALDKPSIVATLALLRAASAMPGRAWVVVDYVPPHGLVPAQTLVL